MKLTNSIVEHILTNLGFMDQRDNSLFAAPLLTEHSITYEDDGTEHHYEVYACETLITQAKITMIGVSFPIDEAFKEMAVVISIENCPTYGCFFNQEDGEGLIAFTMKDNAWMAANMYVQATFLAGMEGLRDVVNPFTKCRETKDIHQTLVSFLKYVDTLTEE